MIRSIRKATRLLLWVCNTALKSSRQGRCESGLRVRLDALAIHRYILTLHRLALNDGDRLILNTSVGSVLSARNMEAGPYFKMAYEDCFFSFAKPRQIAPLLDHHYFQSGQHYRVPIGYHPMFTPPDSVTVANKRAGSIRFVGSAVSHYAHFDEDFWQMPTRLSTLNRVLAEHPEIWEHLHPMDRYRDVLTETEFFLCLPGFSMPLCHNLYESMICGCIPLVHVNYAKWLDRELQSILKPVTYQSDDELLDWIPRIKSGEFISHPEELALAVMAHCKKALSWPSIKSSILSSEKALICAEEVSVKLAMEA